MKKILLISILLLLVSAALMAKQDWTQYYFRFELRNKAELKNITNVISIDNIKGNWVYAYANDWEWAEFQKLGYRTQLLPNPGDIATFKTSSSVSQMREWDSYPNYDVYVAMMYQFASTYPNLCQIVDAGTTVNGRKILFAKISDNISSAEAEPQVMYTSTMHGDETTGYVLMLRLIDTLLSQYGSNPRITNLVNSLEIWINPNANPDGTYYSTSSTTNNVISAPRRNNANGYDINRNFLDPSGNQYSGQPVQTETTLMMNLANAQNFVLCANFHGGAEVVNYPWDHTYTLHPDNSWYSAISRAYASSAQINSPAGYLDDYNNGITNGAAWYVITGGRQDWMNYSAKSREVTIEISSTKNPAASTLPNYWNYNYDAMLTYLEFAQYGIHGIVTDPFGNPLSANINVVGHDNSYTTVKTRAANGDFYRYLSPGTYSLQISASGYPTRTIENVVVTENNKTELNIILGEAPHQQQIALEAGWNLLSFNIELSDTDVEDVFASLSSNLRQVKTATTSYSPNVDTWFNTLHNVENPKGYYLNLSTPATLTLSGSLLNPASNGINLISGWNLVSYLPDEEMTIPTALASISSNLIEVRSIDASWVSSTSRNNLTSLQPGNAYWIKVNQNCTLVYP